MKLKHYPKIDWSGWRMEPQSAVPVGTLTDGTQYIHIQAQGTTDETLATYWAAVKQLHESQRT